jgi:hypothetical protein
MYWRTIRGASYRIGSFKGVVCRSCGCSKKKDALMVIRSVKEGV